MRNVLKLKRNYSILFLLGLALAFMLLSPDSKIEATSKTKDSKQNICGEHLELVWSKALLPPSSPKIKRGPITMQVLPSGENHMVHTVIWKGGESSDTPTDIITFVLDSNGNKLWREDYMDLPFMAHGGEFSVGENTYRHFDSGNLRYHVWLDEKGVIQWVHAQKAISPLYKYHEEGYQSEEVEVVDGVVYHHIANCKNGFCRVDSLKISEKGVDPKGWQTILRWPYLEDRKERVIYQPVSASTSHLLISTAKEITKGSIISGPPYYLILFSPDGIESISTYSFPMMLVKNKEEGFILIGKDTFIRLDKTGKQIEAKSHNLSQKFEASVSAIKPFRDGWLIIGSVKKRKGRDILMQLAMARLSSNGQLLWFHVYDDDLDIAGMDGENVFFSKQGTLYKCREKQVKTGK